MDLHVEIFYVDGKMDYWRGIQAIYRTIKLYMYNSVQLAILIIHVKSGHLTQCSILSQYQDQEENTIKNMKESDMRR